jgi:hypothetical protein
MGNLFEKEFGGEQGLLAWNYNQSYRLLRILLIFVREIR